MSLIEQAHLAMMQSNDKEVKMEVWKIVDIQDDPTKKNKGKPLTLFHGNKGTKVIPLDEVLLADRRVVSDGSSARVYESGFHVLKTLTEAVMYLERFKNLARKRLVKAWVPNYSTFRPKDNSLAWLVGVMVISSGEWEKRLTPQEAQDKLSEK